MGEFRAKTWRFRFVLLGLIAACAMFIIVSFGVPRVSFSLSVPNLSIVLTPIVPAVAYLGAILVSTKLYARQTRLMRGFLGGDPVCWRCIRLVPHNESESLRCPSCREVVTGCRSRPEGKLPFNFEPPRVGQSKLQGHLAAVIVFLMIALLAGIMLVSASISLKTAGKLAVVFVLVGLYGGAIGLSHWCSPARRLRRQLREDYGRGVYHCWMCLYRIDNLAPGTERCPECGALVEISKVEMRRWLSGQE